LDSHVGYYLKLSVNSFDLPGCSQMSWCTCACGAGLKSPAVNACSV